MPLHTKKKNPRALNFISLYVNAGKSKLKLIGSPISSTTGLCHTWTYWHALTWEFRAVTEKLRLGVEDGHPSGSSRLSSVCYAFDYGSLGRKWFKVLCKLGNSKIAPSKTWKGLKCRLVGKESNVAKCLLWLNMLNQTNSKMFIVILQIKD